MSLRLLHVIADAQFGGAQWYLIELASEQRARGHTVTILSGNVGPLTDEYRRAATCFISLSSLRRGLGPWDLEAARAVAQEARDHDIVHVHASKALFVSQLPPNRARVVWSAHGYDSAHAEFPPALRPVLGCAKALLARRCAGVSVASQTVARKLKQAGVLPQRTMVIYTGVREERFGSLPAVRAEPPMLFGAAGRLVRFKGFHVLVDAAARLLADSVPARFLLYGSGPEEMNLRDQVRASGLSDIFQILPATSNFPVALAAMDVVVVPSLVDSFPLVPCEAMVAGRPVVVTRVGGLPEALVDGQHGIIVRPGQVAELADTLAALALAPERVRAMGTAASSYARTRYRWSRVAEEYESLYGLVPA